ncbi:hypothetical protein DERF_004355 [Dermatophagoides farinae]|uniref:Uncharacterized protein n=1 Tax=Dermatophagoides farinae TaxID=6954 RepID=A0A922L9Z5_DERFA|nr:hypothetical protein DERF_004355 [Dermatophagoides farinae]
MIIDDKCENVEYVNSRNERKKNYKIFNHMLNKNDPVLLLSSLGHIELIINKITCVSPTGFRFFLLDE